MNIFLLILAGLLLLIVLLLFCPLVVKITYQDKVQLKIGYLFPLFTIPLKKKKETDPRNTAKQGRKEEEKGCPNKRYTRKKG